MNFHYAISQAQTLYDVEGDMEDLEEIGLIAYNKIGNKNTILKEIQIELKTIQKVGKHLLTHII